MSKHKRDVDQNIIEALKKLKWPLINLFGYKVNVRRIVRSESGFEHISKTIIN